MRRITSLDREAQYVGQGTILGRLTPATAMTLANGIAAAAAVLATTIAATTAALATASPGT